MRVESAWPGHDFRSIEAGSQLPSTKVRMRRRLSYDRCVICNGQESNFIILRPEMSSSCLSIFGWWCTPAFPSEWLIRFLTSSLTTREICGNLKWWCPQSWQQPENEELGEGIRMGVVSITFPEIYRGEHEGRTRQSSGSPSQGDSAGHTCVPSHFVITWYYKVRQLFYYKVRQALLQSATGITKYDKRYLQSTTGITKCDVITKCDGTRWKLCQIFLVISRNRTE